ncbi:MAG: anhydro-N-acetylmuramic acid kinase [Caldimonas sp.]
MTLYIGLMSGTSLDGVDGVIATFERTGASALKVLAHAHRPFPAALQAELLALNTSGSDELHRAALAGNALARAYASVVDALLDSSGSARAAIRAIGAHGQTVRHRPGEFDGVGYTLQLNAPALLAELCGIDVVADLRSRDVAAGGSGAPLVPAFHRAVFGRIDATVAVLNLGGIANLTVLHRDGRTIGFDCGPANALMDHWCRTHRGRAYDADGAWAASGHVAEPLLASMLSEPFFARAAPKSTGRDLFNAGWLTAHVSAFAPVPSEDVQTTLAELTAIVCAQDVKAHAADARDLLVCGGGALNGALMGRLRGLLPGVTVAPTDRFGLPATQVEAAAFAWLAKAFVEAQSGSLAAVTGARGPRVLGALYPAGSVPSA